MRINNPTTRKRRVHSLSRWAAVASFVIAFSAHAGTSPEKRLKRLAEALHSQAPNISARVIAKAIRAYKSARHRHLTEKAIVTVVDYALPSAKKRLAVVDLNRAKVLYYTYVAHGKGSGLDYATHFSNKPGTEASSLGVYLTGKTYYGKHGYSLRLKGLNPSFNGAAYRRDIVVHSAWYVSQAFAKKYGRVGRSWGCFALSQKVEASIVNIIREGTILMAYYPDPQWLSSSPFLKSPGNA